MSTSNQLAKHTITALVEDRPGVLNRIASKWRQRGFNIESLAVGPSEIAGLSRMTFVVDATHDADQVVKQIDKLIDIVEIRDISHEAMVARELALIKVRANRLTRSSIIEIVDIFRANIVDVSADSVIVEVTGDEDKIDAIIELFRDFGILEIMRTGRVAMLRGASPTTLYQEEVPERGPSEEWIEPGNGNSDGTSTGPGGNGARR
jgi:acetolactate synthase-1/3 small subunit